MKPTVISAEALFEEFLTTLHWEWIAGHAHPERHFDDAAIRDARSAADPVGYLNYIHPNRVQPASPRQAPSLPCVLRRAGRTVVADVAPFVARGGQHDGTQRHVGFVGQAREPLA